MEMDDESSSFPIRKPSSQTPGTNKRLRSDSNEQNQINLQTIYRQNEASDTDVSNQQMMSSNRNVFPPIIIELKDKHNNSDRKLIEILVQEWKHKK